MLIPVYRPEITVYERDPEGLWASKNGTITGTLFYPMDDVDGPTEAGSRKVVRRGSEPFFTIIAPEGSELLRINRAVFLKLPGGKKWDAISALILAKRRDDGLDLVRPGRERVADIPEGGPDIPARKHVSPEPATPSGRTMQLSMF